MPQTSTEELGFIPFTKWAGRGEYSTEYEGRTLHVVKQADPQYKNERWEVYEIVQNGPSGSEWFIAKGPTRRQAVVTAMDRLDEHDPKKPLRDAEAAAWWIKALTMAYPEAMNFDPVRAGDSVAGDIIGWTFHVDQGGHRRFGWVAADRRRSHALEYERDQAARALADTVTPTVPVPRALPVQAPAAAGPVKEGRVITARPTECGTCPRYALTQAVREALTALGKYLPDHHPQRMLLAEVTDHYQIRKPDTHPAAAWGALVLPEYDTPGARVYGYWLERGEWHRPGDPGASAPLQMIAERLSLAGFAIESIRDGRVSALHPPRDPGTGEGAGYGDVWLLTNAAGTEVALIECGSHDAMMDLAQCVPHVRAAIGSEGGIVRRRLSNGEIVRRRTAGRNVTQMILHHCEERGHRACGSGTRLVDLDPQNRGRITLPPMDGWSAVTPTYPKGALLIDIGGRTHQAWETVWRDRDGAAVEMVITAAGEEHPVDLLTGHPGGERRVETDAHKGDTAAERSPILGLTPMGDLCPHGHLDVKAAAEALELLRRGPAADREHWETRAEGAGLWAAARLHQATGSLTISLWRMVVRAAADLYSRRLRNGRMHALEPLPERNSFFGSGRRRLEDRCPEGFEAVLSAARHWAYYMQNPHETGERERADQAMRKAADACAAQFTGTDAQDWMAAIRYLAELHVMALVDQDTVRTLPQGL